MTEVKLTITGDIKKMTIGPNDAILIRLNDSGITSAIAEDVREKVKQHFPNNVVLIYGPKVEFEVLKEVK